jgi:hypothetical protein
MVKRIPVLYGEVENLDESSFTSLLKTVTNQKPTKVSRI